jgi:hypothetical protein
MMPQMTPEQAQAILAQPSREEVEQLLRTDVMRMYRIDVETDSTVRADLTRSQENMGKFIEGLAAYTTAIAPLVQSQMMPPDVATDIAIGFSRVFKLGKQAEDALDRFAEHAKQFGASGLPQPPNPEMEKIAVEKERMATESRFKEQEMAAAQEQAGRDHEHRMAQEETKRIGEQAKAEAERVKAESEEKARQEERGMKALELLKGLHDGEEARKVEREKLDATQRLEGDKLADAKVARKEDRIANGKALPEEDEVKAVLEALKALGEQQRDGFEQLKKIMLAPVVLERGKDGRPSGAKRVLQ